MRDNNTYVYTLYRNKGDQILVFDGKGAECAKAMGVTYQWFYKLMTKGGKNRKWTIERRKKNEIEEDGEWNE